MRGLPIASVCAALSATLVGCGGHPDAERTYAQPHAAPPKPGAPGAPSGPSAPDAPGRSLLFNTPEADAIVASMAIFPADNPWNEDISNRPVYPGSSAIIASIGAGAALSFNLDMNFVLIPDTQASVPLVVDPYAAESDPGPFPIPDDAPVEGWPLRGLPPQDSALPPSESLSVIQHEGDGDRHVIVVDPARRRLFELLEGRRSEAGWHAAQSSIFDLASNALRPAGWTSADAAGLPVFPAIVRFTDVESGIVSHAMRVTAPVTRRAYVYPARHYSSSSDSPSLPRMGERLRLRRDFDATSFPPHARAVLEGLKRYGMLVADNGLPWRLSIAPDPRIQGLDALTQVHGSDFEVIETTGPDEGPRAH